MPVKINSTASESSGTSSLAATSIWAVAGFLFPLLTPATTFLSVVLQGNLSSATGISEEMAYYVAFTIFRIPLTAGLGVLVAVAQCALIEGVRRLARRWITAAAVGASISTLIFLPTTLVVYEVTGMSNIVRVFLLVLGAGLLSGLVSFLHWRIARREGFLRPWFVAANVIEAALGVLVELILLEGVL